MEQPPIERTPEELAAEKLTEECRFARETLQRHNATIATLDRQIAEHQSQIALLQSKRDAAIRERDFVQDKLQPTIDAYEAAQPKVEMGAERV